MSLSLLSGCNNSNPAHRIGTTGTVRVNNEPLASGMIEFFPSEESGQRGTSSGAEIKEGKFSIDAEDGPSAGPYLIRVRAYHPTGQKVNAKNDPSEPDHWVDEIAQYLPERYNVKTVLKHDFQPGVPNVVDLELTVP